LEQAVRENPSVAVIGMGYVGSCIAATLADRGLEVVGVDTDDVLIKEMSAGHVRFRERELAEIFAAAVAAGRLRASVDYAATRTADVVIVAVGTPVHEDGSLSDAQLRGACEALSSHIRPGQLLIFKSTVPPGTSAGLIRPLLERGGLTAGTDFLFAFSPERIAEATAMADLRTIPTVIGGINPASARAAADFWHRALGGQVLPVASLEAAEIVKLADNWWIDLNIALANELAKFCALYGVDVLEVIEAANSVPKGNGHVNILLPSAGVGGSCLTKDPLMVVHSAQRRGLTIRTAAVGREVNAGMPAYTAGLIMDELRALGKNLTACTVAVLGLAFKNDTGDLRATPAREVIAALTGAGLRVRAFDPLVDASRARELLGFAPAGSLAEAVAGADCVAILALHREFAAIDFAALTAAVADRCLILDGRAYYPREKVAALRGLGYRYRGIGR
jgi:dTDP-alpha-D-glucose dehydrogenase